MYLVILIPFKNVFGEAGVDERVSVPVKDGVQYLKFITTATAGTGGTKYRTLGWQISFDVNGNGKTSDDYKMIYPMNDGGQTGTIIREIPFRGEYSAILETLCRGFGSGGDINNPDNEDKKIINYMFRGGTVYIDAVQTVVRNGVYDYAYANTNNGALNMDSKGQLVGTTGGLHFSYSSIAGAVAWSGTAITDLKTYYNISKVFTPEMVPHYIHYIYSQYMEGQTIYDSIPFATRDEVIVAGINTNKTLTADDYTSSTRTFKSLRASYTDSIKESFINITSKSIVGFDFGATGTYNPNIYITSFYEVKKPANPIASLGVRDAEESTVHEEDGYQFYTLGTTMNLMLVDKSYYDNLDIIDLKIKDLKTNAIVFTGTDSNDEYNLKNKPIGTYQYQIDITLEGGKKISDAVSFKIVKGEEPEEESTLKATGDIDAPVSVLEIYNTADATFSFRASSNYELNGWRIIDGAKYVVGEDSGDFEGYSDSKTVNLKIPVNKKVTISVRTWDYSGERASAEDIADVDTKEIRPVAGNKISMLKEEPNRYTSKEYKQYKKIKIDTNYSDILTDDDVLAYAPNNYSSSLTAVEIQPVTSGGALDVSRLPTIKFADESKVIRESDKITLRGDVTRTAVHYARFDASGYYRIRNKVTNDYKTSVWSSYNTIYVAPDQAPVINSFDIIAMEKDNVENYYSTSKYYNNTVNMWSIYRNPDDLVSRFKIRVNYASLDDEIGDINLYMSYDDNGDLDVTNDSIYSNMLITKDTNQLQKVNEEDVFRVISKSVGQNITEIIIEISNTNRNLFGKLHFELEAVEKPIYPNYIEGNLSAVPILSANILAMDNLNKNIYIDNLTPNLSAETEKDSIIELYLQNETNISYYSSIEPSLLGVFKTRLAKKEFDSGKILSNITSKDTNLWEEYSSSPYGYTVGNTSGNYQMGGMYTQKDGWMYYTSGSSIRKFRIGTWDEDTLVCSLPVSSSGQISLVNGWFYFDSEKSIWKIKVDGTGAQQILSLSTSYYLHSLYGFAVKDNYLYFRRMYKERSSSSKRYDITRINVDIPVLNFTEGGFWDTHIKSIAGGSYDYASLDVEDKYLLYTRDKQPYKYDIMKEKNSYMVDRNGSDLTGYRGYMYFYGQTSRQDHLYRIPLTATDRDYDSVDGDEGHIQNYNLLNDYIFWVKNSTFNNPLGKTMLYRASSSGDGETVVDKDGVSSGTTLYSMGGYIAYSGKKMPAWDLPVINLTPQDNKYGDNTNFSVRGTVTGQGTVWVRCQIGNKLVKQTFTNPSNATFNLNFNTKDFTEGIYKNIIVTATTSNGVYNKADVGDITIRKILANLKENISGMPITGNNGTRVIFLDNNIKIDDNADNQALITVIKPLITERQLGIYASDTNNTIIRSLVSDFAGLTAEDNYNLNTANISESANKVTNYIDIRKSITNTAYFAISRDELKCIKTFYDEEKDYKLSDSYTMEGKITKINGMLFESIKNEKEGTLKVTFEHDPSVWHNPVTVYKTANNGVYNAVSSKYDGLNGKQIITDLLGNKYLMGSLNDDMRGKWKAKLQAYDDTGNPLFDKKDTTEVSFYIHKPPVPKFSNTETATILTLNDNGSYDIDMQYAHNNGIAKYKWRYLVRSVSGQETWIDAGEGEELKSIEVIKAGRNITDYELTVWDLQGCSTSISKDYLLLDSPSVDFDFVVGENVTNYVYKGNVGSECVSVNTDIKWNDDAYNSLLYSSSGIRTVQITNDKEQRTNEIDFNLQVLTKPIINLEKDKNITVRLSATNKYDITSTKGKSTNVKEIYTTNNTNNYVSYQFETTQGFLSGGSIPINVTLTGLDGVNHDDMLVKTQSIDLGLGENQLNYVGGGIYTRNFTIPAEKTGEIKYTVNVYSKRTGQLICKKEYASFADKMPQNESTLSNFRVAELKDTKLANYYINPVNNESKEIDMGVNLMAIDKINFGGIPVTKGYKLVFKINSNNLNETNDKIRIVPHFYTISGDVRDNLERDVYWINSEHQIYKAGENAHSKYSKLMLDSNNRVTINETEAVWRGEYLLPATAFAVPKGYIPKTINDSNLKKDIIVAFEIVAEKETTETYNYNTGNWIIERITPKTPYEIGDVIRYNYTTNGALDDVGVYRVR